ncbi:hypothetical protein EHI8A_001510 [Entamoeba histolytica HM-1:IMSS-B]|uniref:Uncharacterized protein n=6 Tax=Entamoeba histolytica TaxID=5759 RepID=B1N3G9_ENTH1|nr:hypothetical protein EHI_158030 [Entamoeba histolytica HM-1:IMSS]EMD48587.1 Hypothetical protein EHI5A_007670 [Entamoeba histolytica KU27]EMH72177.1 hypothetical protein EHI8A_001510 [Entamoeba histolytica HM-1:IMSS-B]EMS14650.1 hypothetical protein KM1_011900 [Entamoeba histolytica HM-3:IMSS]ENY60923.1 hypothetical protein EHI7A_002840 [Entamoeba histolytica HM-1:IMSS-A]GAT95424.1 hypothetical protein CL6EHI_158030 [Entamoeba histolytica]|eukprot:XP_001913735.1 hypothetical protein EHI_158030 [Entamoeba histolytica HM-1:IMSS]
MEYVTTCISQFPDEYFDNDIKYLTQKIEESIEKTFFNGSQFNVCKGIIHQNDYLVLYIQKPENGKAVKYFIKNHSLQIFQYQYEKGWVLNVDSQIKKIFRSDAPYGFISKFIEIKK